MSDIELTQFAFIGITQPYTRRCVFACGSKVETINFVRDFSARSAEKSRTKKKLSTAAQKAYAHIHRMMEG